MKKASASKLQEWVSAAWKRIAGKTAELLLKKCCTDALDGTEDDILCGSSDLDCPDLKSHLEECVDSERESGCTSVEDSD
jgi:hypothetical protein